MKIIGFLLLFVASAFAVIKSIHELLIFIRIKKSGPLVKAKIIDFKEDRSGDNVTYPAVVSFTTITGDKITATSRSSTSIKPTIGNDVWIVYSPNDPSIFYFKRSFVIYFIALTILMFGITLILLTVELLKVL